MAGLVDGITADIQERAVNLVQNAADLLVTKTQARTSRRTGALADGISHDQPVLTDAYVMCTITSEAEYSEWQNVGTGIYGPSGARIVPLRPGGVLAFDWPAFGGMAFFKSVAGSPGTHFWDFLAEDWPASLFESQDTFSQ